MRARKNSCKKVSHVHKALLTVVSVMAVFAAAAQQQAQAIATNGNNPDHSSSMASAVIWIIGLGVLAILLISILRRGKKKRSF